MDLQTCQHYDHLAPGKLVRASNELSNRAFQGCASCYNHFRLCVMVLDGMAYLAQQGHTEEEIVVDEYLEAIAGEIRATELVSAAWVVHQGETYV